MAVFKCKMCGGSLEIQEGMTVCECEYCGSKQTVPQLDNEKKITLFTRANRLRSACEFDKASGVYESIVTEFPEEAEAYWGLVLCKYGIEYVDDPKTGKKIPTCHRSSFDSVLDDSNYEQACENTDALARRVYRDEARAIEDLRKDIIEVSGKEEPYDIFISYKETDEHGDRTLDSVIAQDIYKELTNAGYRVFFSRITLENKLGTEYEPYIFAALNSARVMVVVGTDYENFDSVWVKNEWSRFLKLSTAGQKKTLIPVFKNMDAYDMPKEFARLSALNMGKLGAMQDLLRGIEKMIGKKHDEKQPETAQVNQGISPSIDSLLDRAFVFLEDREWAKASEYADKVLDLNVRNGKAYLVKLMADLNVERADDLAKLKVPFYDHPQFLKIQRFGGEDLNNQVNTYNRTINERNQAIFEQRERERKLEIREKAKNNLNTASSIDELLKIRTALRDIVEFDGVAELLACCEEKGAKLRQEERERLERLQELEVRRQKIGEKAGAMKEDFDHKRELYNLQYSKITDARKKVAAAQEQKQKCEKRLSEANAELSSLTGLFTGKRRRVLEENIADEERKLVKCKEEVEWCQNEYYSELSNLPEEPKNEELSYEIGMLYYQAELYKDAYARFVKLGTYKDVDKLLATDNHFDEVKAHGKKKSPSCDIGSIISFGTYEKAQIEWIVLAKDQNRRLLVSRNAIEGKPFENNNGKALSWSDCSLRNWLNNTFYNTAFNPMEQTAIIKNRTDNSAKQADNRYSQGIDGKGTDDKVFLLSYGEAAKYFTKNNRSCRPTPHATATGLSTTPGGTCEWWLRSLTSAAQNRYYISTVDGNGTLSRNGNRNICGVRPAIWVDLKANYFR